MVFTAVVYGIWHMIMILILSKGGIVCYTLSCNNKQMAIDKPKYHIINITY